MSRPRLAIRDSDVVEVHGTCRDQVVSIHHWMVAILLAPTLIMVACLLGTTSVALVLFPTWLAVTLGVTAQFVVILAVSVSRRTKLSWRLTRQGQLRTHGTFLGVFPVKVQIVDDDAQLAPVRLDLSRSYTTPYWDSGSRSDETKQFTLDSGPDFGALLYPDEPLRFNSLSASAASIVYVRPASPRPPVGETPEQPYRPVRVEACEPWPTVEAEWAHPNASVSGNERVVARFSLNQFPGVSVSLLVRADAMLEQFVRTASVSYRSSPSENQGRHEPVIVRGWTAIPHASWTIVDGFPRQEAAVDSPFRSRATGGDDWEWTAAEDVSATTAALERDSAESWPTRIVVRGDTLYATEPGTALVGALPLNTLRQVTDKTPRFDRFRFGRATDVILPKDSEAARRLRAELAKQIETL
jgi:hypothetical protein